MPFRNLLVLAFKDFFARKGRLFLSILGIICGVASLLFLLSLIESVKRTVKNELIGKIPITEMTVRLKERKMGYSLSADYSSFNEDLVDFMKGLDGVDKIYPVRALDISAEMEGKIKVFGKLPIGTFRTETAVFGVPREIVMDGLKHPEKYVFDPEAEEIPIVISKSTLEVYNIGLAKTLGYGRFHEDALLGQEFELSFGDVPGMALTEREGRRSRDYGIEPVTCKVIGVSKRAPMMGISVPLDYIQYWREKYARGDPRIIGEKQVYEYIILRTKGIDYVEPIRKDLEALNRETLEVRADGDMRIVELLAENDQDVSFLRPLFVVERLSPAGEEDAPSQREEDEEEIDGNIIKAVKAGTFYGGGSPDSGRYHRIGDVVHEGDVLYVIDNKWLDVRTQKDTLQKLNSISRIISLVFGTFGLIILVISAISIFNMLTMSVNEEKVDIAILRSVGARKMHIRLIYMLKAGLVGVIGGLDGIMIGFIVMWIGDKILLSYLRDYPFIPKSFFAPTWQLVLICFFIGLFFSVIAGIAPANHAAKLKPAVVLRQG